MKLNVLAIKNAKPKPRAYKLSDGYGLYVLVNPKGRKLWRYNYRYNGKYKTLSLGIFPNVGLKAAREAHQAARQLLEQGRDPNTEKKLQQYLQQSDSDHSFQNIATEWLARQQPIWTKSYYETVHYRLNHYVFEILGTRPISSITSPELLQVLRRIEIMGLYETAHRVRAICGQVFRYAIVIGRSERDPSADLKEALISVRSTPFPAITDPSEVGGLLRAINGYSGNVITHCALKLAALTFVRPGELRRAEWSEIKLSAAEWSIPAEKMKMRNEHIVPLSKQAIEVLKTIYPVTHSGNYVFPSTRTRQRPLSENTINAALRRMGYSKTEMTGHGFRSMASTLLNEQGFNSDWIEVQLAHTEKNKVRAAYNRAYYLPQRKIMMQKWADYLDTLQQQSPAECNTSNEAFMQLNPITLKQDYRETSCKSK